MVATPQPIRQAGSAAAALPLPAAGGGARRRAMLLLMLCWMRVLRTARRAAGARSAVAAPRPVARRRRRCAAASFGSSVCHKDGLGATGEHGEHECATCTHSTTIIHGHGRDPEQISAAVCPDLQQLECLEMPNNHSWSQARSCTTAARVRMLHPTPAPAALAWCLPAVLAACLPLAPAPHSSSP